MKDFQETIDKIFNEIEIRLSAKLLTEGFQIHSQISTPKDFGSRYTEWRNENDKYALRLIWDGKESWFSIEESPLTKTSAPNSWTDIVLVPVDKTKVTDVSYSFSVVEDIVNDVK
jgi:hypothetical protein